MSKKETRVNTTVAPEVLVKIAQLATLQVTGVSRMAPVAGGVNRFFKREATHGVRLKLEDDLVYADIHVILAPNVNVRNTCREIQQQVARAIQEMVGLEVGHVNIHVEDIDYPEEQA